MLSNFNFEVKVLNLNLFKLIIDLDLNEVDDNCFA